MFSAFMKVIILVVALYVVLVVVLAGCQRSMIYLPQKLDAGMRERIAAARGLQPWLDEADQQIGWRRGSPDSGQMAAVLIFHGNAGHAAARPYFAEAFSDSSVTGRAGWVVYLMEYPGYGVREGKPSEETLVSAGVSAVGQLAERHEQVYVIGESLGTGVACQVAGERPESVDGLLLISPFPSLVSVARQHLGWLPVGLVLKDRYESQGALENYPGPVAVLVAGRDDVVAPELSNALYQEYEGKKRRWLQPDRGHNSLDMGPSAAWWGEVVEFWRSTE